MKKNGAFWYVVCDTHNKERKCDVFMDTHKVYKKNEVKYREKCFEFQDIKRRRKWQFLGILVSNIANKESNQSEK